MCVSFGNHTLCRFSSGFQDFIHLKAFRNCLTILLIEAPFRQCCETLHAVHGMQNAISRADINDAAYALE